jgi:Fe-Mn family superoxide dismutase
MYEPKPLKLDKQPKKLSKEALAIHYDKLYKGYVTKKEEIGEKLKEYATGKKDLSNANQTYSELRALKDSETFAVNGVYLHEHYFAMLGSGGIAEGPLADALIEKHGSIENFLNYFAAQGMAARGWVVLAWNTHEAQLNIYTGDAHNQGGVWGAIPIIVLDIYEHAYFIDYGSDRKSYITDFINELNWGVATEKFEKAKSWSQ